MTDKYKDTARKVTDFKVGDKVVMYFRSGKVSTGTVVGFSNYTADYIRVRDNKDEVNGLFSPFQLRHLTKLDKALL